MKEDGATSIRTVSLTVVSRQVIGDEVGWL
jgi:hypothetical protein